MLAAGAGNRNGDAELRHSSDYALFRDGLVHGVIAIQATYDQLIYIRQMRRSGIVARLLGFVLEFLDASSIDNACCRTSGRRLGIHGVFLA
jgi:hypothetical protein